MKKNFLSSFIFLCCALLINKFAIAQTYVTNGDASLIDVSLNEYRLSFDVQGSNGSVWYQNKIDLRNDFTVSGEINLGTRDGDGADGIAFVLQPLSVNAGGAGGGIGYFGINPSFAVEFDTYYNGDRFDPFEDHCAIQLNGDVTHDATHTVAGPTAFPGNIEDGLWHRVIFSWNATTKNFRMYWNGSATPFFDVVYDISAGVFSGSPYAYFGFTAATGSLTNEQKVRISSAVFVSEGVAGSIKNASCSSVADGGVDITATGLTAPLIYQWSNGTITEDLTSVLPGTYVVTVKDAAIPQRSIISTFVVGADVNATTWYKDADKDGYSDGTTETICVQPSGYKMASELIAISGDCNDDNINVNPGATEICGNGIDDNCNGQIDEGCVLYIFYKDADTDTYGDPTSSVTNYTGVVPAGYVANNSDCNDDNINVNPGATEICGNGIDDNCNGQTDEGCNTGVCSYGTAFSTTNITASSAKLNWTATADPIEWYVRYKATSNTNNSKWVELILTGDKRSLVISPLAANQNYQWQIRAKCATGITENSGAIKFTTTSSAPGRQASVRLGSIETSGIQLYPNPTKGQFTLKLQLAERINCTATIQLLDISGKAILTDYASVSNGYLQKTINTKPTMANSIYMVRTLVNGKAYLTKLMFEK